MAGLSAHVIMAFSTWMASTVWITGYPLSYSSVKTITSSQNAFLPIGMKQTRNRLKMFGTKNSQDSSATSSTTMPNLVSMFNGTNKESDDLKDETYSTRQQNIASKFSNNDVYIDNFSADSDTDRNPLPLAVVTAVTVGVGIIMNSHLEILSDPSILTIDFPSLVGNAKEVLADPGAALDHVVELTDSMGTLGIAYFGVAYCIAEILAVPAIPLTASAGYLFGPVKGTAIVLLSASVAAGVSFQIGRTLLRDYVENILKDYPKFAKIDKAIGKEGFKLMLLLRLSPIFPFALSNYLYGASSINFPAFFGGTVLGFAPGTLAYVYTGYVGKALTGDTGGDVYPWYVYLGGLTLFAGILKVVADTATRVVEEIEAEEASNNFDA